MFSDKRIKKLNQNHESKNAGETFSQFLTQSIFEISPKANTFRTMM